MADSVIIKKKALDILLNGYLFSDKQNLIVISLIVTIIVLGSLGAFAIGYFLGVQREHFRMSEYSGMNNNHAALFARPN